MEIAERRMTQLSCILLVILISFHCYQGTAGDSDLQTDSNTEVGKPQLGKETWGDFVSLMFEQGENVKVVLK